MQPKIILTFEDDDMKYTVNDGKIFYVKISKPCAASDINNPCSKPSLAPYLNRRNVSYGVLNDNENGYSYKHSDIQKIRYVDPIFAKKRFDDWCHEFGCSLSWESAKNIADMYNELLSK